MATVMASPTTGSARSHPAATPSAPTTTASDVRPSVRAWCPSATRAAEPIFVPTRIRYTATPSLPANPIRPAAITQGSAWMLWGWRSRASASRAATADDAAMITTITMPARSSARPYP